MADNKLSYEPYEVLSSGAGEDDPQEIEMLLQDFSNSLFPINDSIQIKDVDNLLAQEFTQLSVAEREDVLCDVHAVVKSGILQTPSLETRTKALQQVRRIIQDEIPAKDKEAYEQAMKRDSSYAGADHFLLRFIRAANWDARAAAQTIVAHFKIKLELFPPHLLCLDITQDDMDPTTLDILYSGFSQDLPLRDMAGRLITIVVSGGNADMHQYKLRRMFYGAMVQTEDLETQVKGRVVIIWLQDRSHGLDYSFSQKIRNLMKGLPIKNVAIHVCMPGNSDPGFAQVTGLAAIAFAMLRILLVRMKFHCGTPTELKHKLQDFGIPCSILPISETGEVGCEHVNQRWTKRRHEERTRRQTKATREAVRVPDISFSTRSSQESSRTKLAPTKIPMDVESSDSVVTHLVQTPSNTDVLLGRGIHTRKHCGNILFGDLIAKRLVVYDSLPNRTTKISMSAEIVQQVKGEFGGRFLVGRGSGWVEVADAVARDKVATAFRTLRRSRRKT